MPTYYSRRTPHKLDQYMYINKLPLVAYLSHMNSKMINPENVKHTCYDICKSWEKVEWDGKQYVEIANG